MTGGTSPRCWQRSGWRRLERRPDAQFRRAKRVGFRLRPMGVRSARVRSPYPRRPGLEELFRSLLMGAQAAPEGDVSLQQVPQTAVPGMAQAPAAAEEGAVLLQPGQQTAGGEQLPVPAEPALAGEAESTVQAEVLPAAEDGGTATAQAVTPVARESGAQTPADAGETAGPSGPAGSRSCPSWTVCRRRGRRSRSLTGQSTCR